jgi:hypothetical protein
MNPYLTERLARQRQAELLQEAQELRDSYGPAAPGALTARLWAWARRLVAAGRAPLGRGRGGQARRTEA